MVLSGSQGGEFSLDDMMGIYCALGTHAQSGKLPIKQIVDHPLRTMVYTIGNVVETRSAHLTTREHMLYALECMTPTVFKWCKGMLAILNDRLKTRKWG